MGQLMMEKISNADMLIFNHCNEELRAQLRSRNLRMVNRRADIYLENEDQTAQRLHLTVDGESSILFGSVGGYQTMLWRND